MRVFYSILLFILFLFSGELHALPTKIVIRVKAKDAKFIGTGIGGAAVIVRDNISGSVLSRVLHRVVLGIQKQLCKHPWPGISPKQTVLLRNI